jgi:phosphopantothenoylcysteine decarboxylase/phosphopantothenate--cysteine ligase
MLEALERKFTNTDLLVMSAAVADFRPSFSSTDKIDKSDLTSLTLVKNPDLLKSLVAKRSHGQIIIGFAAQTGELAMAKATAKLNAKGLDAIFVNDVSGGAIFGADSTEGAIIDREGNISPVASTSKDSLAHLLLDVARNKLG